MDWIYSILFFGLGIKRNIMMFHFANRAALAALALSVSPVTAQNSSSSNGMPSISSFATTTLTTI